jgi:hypothetical protein
MIEGYMKQAVKVLNKIGSAIGTVLGAWVSVSLLGIGKLTAVAIRVKKSIPRES